MGGTVLAIGISGREWPPTGRRHHIHIDTYIDINNICKMPAQNVCANGALQVKTPYTDRIDIGARAGVEHHIGSNNPGAVRLDQIKTNRTRNAAIGSLNKPSSRKS